MTEDAITHKDLYGSVGSWHGTGRYKYEGNKTIDVLRNILSDGGLIPYIDVWDQKRPDAQSISFARARSYARLYASLYFPASQRDLRELWNRFTWSCQYFLSSKWVAWTEYLPPNPHILDYKTKLPTWTGKFTRESQSFTQLFLWGGTDIPSNYPILIGIRKGAYVPTRGSRFIDLHEDRSPTPILLRDFTHIEVPERHMAETLEVLKAAKCELPIIALEEGDRYRK